MIHKSLRAYRLLVVAVLLAALAVLACAQPASAPPQQAAKIAIGPYIQNVSKDCATICWATRDGRVTSGPAGGEATTAGVYTHHSLLLRELKPGTAYTYDVLGDGSDLGKGTFTTFPAGEQPFRFVVTGDTQGHNYVLHRRHVEMMMADKPDLLLHVGDLVSEGRDITDWEKFFEVNGDFMRNVPYFTALGNHEMDGRYYFDFFSLPHNERYYSFNRGPAHFIVLDSPGPQPPEDNQAPTTALNAEFGQQMSQFWQGQMAWLRDDLESYKDAKYIFVFSHYPLYTMAHPTRRGYILGAQQMRGIFGTMFQDHNVSAVFTGHDHQYHRAVFGGTQFITAGYAGGAPREPGERWPETVKFAQAVTHVRVDVGPERAQVRVTDIDGGTVDQFEIPARASAPK